MVVAMIVEVFMEDVELQQDAIGITHPEFGLAGVAAGHAVFTQGFVPGLFQPHLNGDEFFRVEQAEADVIERAARTGTTGDEGEHRGWGFDFELGVVGVMLGGIEAKQYAIKGHRAVEVGDVEGEVKFTDGSAHAADGRGRKVSTRRPSRTHIGAAIISVFA